MVMLRRPWVDANGGLRGAQGFGGWYKPHAPNIDAGTLERDVEILAKWFGDGSEERRAFYRQVMAEICSNALEAAPPEIEQLEMALLGTS